MTQEAKLREHRERHSRALDWLEKAGKPYRYKFAKINDGGDFEEYPSEEEEFIRAALSQPAPDVNLDVAKAKTPEGWKPIETAPMDGTPVLLFIGGALSMYGLMMNGVDKEGKDVGPTWFCAPFGHACEPTHWMPLPAAPVHEETDDR